MSGQQLYINEWLAGVLYMVFELTLVLCVFVHFAFFSSRVSGLVLVE